MLTRAVLHALEPTQRLADTASTSDGMRAALMAWPMR
jgi:hypothetical protein